MLELSVAGASTSTRAITLITMPAQLRLGLAPRVNGIARLLDSWAAAAHACVWRASVRLGRQLERAETYFIDCTAIRGSTLSVLLRHDFEPSRASRAAVTPRRRAHDCRSNPHSSYSDSNN